MFQNPWAWLGLAAVAAPVLIHLLARQPARRIPFPTLRFLPATRLAPIRRGRLSDVALLLVRCGVIAAAVAALAQPDWSRGPVILTGQPALARAILVDTSWSLSREAGGGSAAVEARREAESLRATATTARVVDSPLPTAALGAATNWLAQQPMRRELILISDFQTGAIEREDLNAIPDGIGIRLVRIDEPTPAAASAQQDPSAPPAIQILAGPAGQSGAEAARRAAEARGAPTRGRRDRTVALVFPDFDRRSELLAAVRPLDQPWMFDVVTRVARGDQAHLYLDGLQWSAGAAGTNELRIFADTTAGSLGSAALVAAAARAASPDPDPAELNTATIADATLRTWERPASDVAPVAGRDPDRFDGRWMWGLALALLAVEAVVRRGRRSPSPVEMSHERAA